MAARFGGILLSASTMLVVGLVLILAAFPLISHAEDIQPERKSAPDKTSILFNEGNFKKGEMIKFENRSGSDRTVGIELPTRGLVYSGVVRIPEQIKVPFKEWDRITVAHNTGIAIFLIPEPERIEMLDGKDIVVKVGRANRVEEVYRIPIKVSPELISMTVPPDRVSPRLPGQRP